MGCPAAATSARLMFRALCTCRSKVKRTAGCGCGFSRQSRVMTMNKSTQLAWAALCIVLLIYSTEFAQRSQGQPGKVTRSLHEVNQVARPDANHVIAIVGATLIDGRGGAPVPDSVVVVRGEKIV